MKKILVSFLFVLVSISSLFAADDIFRIKKVVFDGLQNVKPKAVRSEIKLKKGKVYSPTIAREDLRTLLGLGYFDNAEISVDKDKKIVKFKLSEKPYIKSIIFKGNKQFSAGKLKSESTLKEKDFYNFFELEETKRKILTLYHDKGYADCQMEVYPTTDADTNIMTITFLITENNKILIGDLYIDGVESFNPKKIKKLAKTKQKKVFKEETLKMDIGAITTFYKNRGFMDMSVSEPIIKYNDERTKMYIYLTVTEGMRYRIDKVSFEGNTVISSKDLLKNSSIKKKEIFSQEKILELLNGVYDDYSDRGYLHSYIAPDFQKSDLDEDKNKKKKVKEKNKVSLKDTKRINRRNKRKKKYEEKKVYKYTKNDRLVDVTYNIQENNIVYVGDIYIDGLSSTKDLTIRREVLLKPGDVFSSGKLKRSIEKIYNLGFIDGAEPNIIPTGSNDIMNLALNITEGKPGMITAGAGYSSVDKFVGSIQLQHMNLFGRAQRLNLLWEFGARRQNYEIDWTEPWFLGKPMSLGLSVYDIVRLRDYHNTSDAYREGRIGGSVSISPRLSDKLSLLFGYTYEYVRLYDIDSDELKQEILNDPDLAKDRTSSVRAQIIYDSRDYIYDASRGARYSYGVNVAGGPFGGNVNYVRNSVRGTWFFPTFWKFVLSVNINAGWIESYGESSDVPLYEKYYVGGADTIRGYKYRTEVGPYNGGKIMTVANVEYKFPIVQEKRKTILQGAFFYDIGGTWKDINHVNFSFGTDNDDNNEYYLKSGVGFGIRFATPVFPLRLDWGYGLNHKKGEDLQQFYFTIGNVF